MLRVTITPAIWTSLLTQGTNVNFTVTAGLPVGAVLVDVDWSFSTNNVSLIFDIGDNDYAVHDQSIVVDSHDTSTLSNSSTRHTTVVSQDLFGG